MKPLLKQFAIPSKQNLDSRDPMPCVLSILNELITRDIKHNVLEH